VGCGPGKFRFNLDPLRVSYYGLDPIVLPEVADFPFVQGLAEHMPFQDDSFTDIVVLAALDHFRDLDRFLAEARRVLEPGGRLHILQSVHEARGPISAVRGIAHRVKDAIEERDAPDHARDIPKHLSEFTTATLVRRIGQGLDLTSSQEYHATWYSPVKLFLSFSRTGVRGAAVRPGAA
jgi:ubiquinone/menaquinone biosynthesis C-methylase UbiE